MGIADGNVLGVTKVLDQGPDSSQWNLVVLGDGYAATQQSSFDTTVDNFIDILETILPFSEVATWDHVNVHRINIESNETGADDPAACADGTLPFLGLATTAATYLDAAYCSSGLRRLLTVDAQLAMDTASDWVPNWDLIVVFVNHAEEGGSGDDSVAVSFSAGIYDSTVFHEMGHSGFGLADEYPYLQGCASGETTQDVYPLPFEPIELNLTIDPLAAPKWGLAVDPATPLPTLTNPNPADCPPDVSPVAAGVIGTFEGAGHYHSGIYRPAFTCKMNEATEDFCTICANVIRTRIFLDKPCFVVSAVYADPFAPDVVTIREWRDRHLQAGARGAAWMRRLHAIYWRVGPVMARFVRPRRRLAQALRRCVLAPWARRLRRGNRSARSARPARLARPERMV